MRLHYDKLKRRVYIFGEIQEVKLSNRNLAEKIKEKRWNDTVVYVDEAEPKDKDDIIGYGIRAVAAPKGRDSKEFGEKWLDDLEEIIIDPVRCPNTTRQFETADYETDRDGNVIPRLCDDDLDAIDACRYALVHDMVKVKKGMRGVPITYGS